MKMRFFLALLSLALAQAATQAQITVNYGAYPGQRNVTVAPTGTPLADGNTVEVGYFNSTLDLSANAGNLGALLDNWHLFGSTEIVSISGPGQFAGVSANSDSQFFGKPIAIWIFDTGGAPLAADLSNVRTYGVFTDAAWSFPKSTDNPPFLVQISSADPGISGFHATVVGDLETGTLLLDPVPEPSALSLLSLGFGMAVLAVRRVSRR